MIFLDNASTTKIDPRVLKAMMPYLKDRYANASSRHQFGQDSANAVENAREQVAKLIGAKSDQIFFTNSATEANNIAINYLGFADVILTTNSEHSSIIKCIKHLKETKRIKAHLIKIDKNGTLNLLKLQKMLVKYNPKLLSIIFANNEIGTIHNIHDIGELCAKYKALLHTDATQAIGKVPININETNIFALTMSGHKIYGPKGVGAIYVKEPIKLSPLILGGLQNTLSSGTINHPAIIGFGKACELMMNVEEENKRIGQLRDVLLEKLISNIDSAYVNGTMENRLPGNISLTIPGLDTRMFVECLEDIFISSGSACMSANPKPSPTIKAIGVEHPGSVIRIGVGRFNTMDEIEEAGNRIIHLVKEMRNR